MERCTVVPYEGEQKYIFISYSHRDAAVAVPILERLSAEGYRLWYDEGIDPGSEWPETIADHLGRACACVGLISNNYLASDNCRREMNYALKKQIPYLSVMLEETEMSAGVEMQLSANQAIFKYKLPSEEAFYQKINATKFLQPTRVLPVQKAEKTVPAEEAAPDTAPAPAAEAPAPVEETPVPAAETPAPAAEMPPVPVPQTPAVDKKGRSKTSARAKTKEKTPEGAKPKKKSRKILLIVLAALAALAVLIAVVAGIAGAGSGRHAASEPEHKKDPASAALTDTLLDGEYAERVLWGEKVQTDFDTLEQFVQQMNYTDITLGGNVTNVTATPYAVEVRADEHADVLRLTFYDKLGRAYTAEGSYNVAGEVLTVDPCGKTYDDALSLDGRLEFSIRCTDGGVSLMPKEGGRTVEYTSPVECLQGASDVGMYQEFAALYLPECADGKTCTLAFTDGGKTLDAAVDAAYTSIGSIFLKWTREQRLYNGTMADFDAKGTLSFYYINTYPYGFILLKDYNAYLYQKPYSLTEETAEEPTEADGNDASGETTEAPPEG